MTIEVKQIIIKSTVNSSSAVEQVPMDLNIDLEQFKEMLLDECREMIQDTLNGTRER